MFPVHKYFYRRLLYRYFLKKLKSFTDKFVTIFMNSKKSSFDSLIVLLRNNTTGLKLKILYLIEILLLYH